MVEKSQVFSFQVKKAPLEDIGKDRVRLHWKRRLGLRRFVVLLLKNDAGEALVSALGHEDAEDIIQMDIDLRSKLALSLGSNANISIARASWVQELRWYLSATDPAVRIPAWLGAWSLVIGVASILFSLL
jgi:hypothetical protein